MKKNRSRSSDLANADQVNQAILLAKEDGIQDVIAAKEQKAKKIPHRYNSNRKDGATRYESADGKCNFAIIKRDGKYKVYDYIKSELVEFPDVKKLNAFLAALNTGMAENERASVVAESTQENTEETKKAAESAEDNSEVDSTNYFVRDNSPNEFNPDGKSLKGQLEEALDDSQSKDRRYVYVGKFTNEFAEALSKFVDIKDYPVVMNYRDAYLSMESKENGKYQGERINYHNLGVDGLEMALLSFNEPEYILLSPKEGKIELLLKGKDYKDRQLISIVEINTKTQHDSRFIDVHVVNSVYGNKGIQNRIETAKKDGRLIYNKKESAQGMPRVQYKRDVNANSLNGDKTITTTSIPDSEQKINPSEKNSSENLGEITRKVFKIAKEKVVGYEKLDANGRRAVRGVMRQAIAHGYTEDVAADIGSVAARSGAKVTFDYDACLREKADGTEYYVNGFYSRVTDTITLNPNSAKNVDVLLLHELLHDMFANSGKKGKKAYDKLRKLALSKMPEAERKKIEDRYREHGYNSSEAIEEEITAHYGEEFTNRAFLKALVSEDASIMERIIDFFTKAKDDYAGSEKLSRSAKKFLKTYKKMFDEFSASHRNNIGYGDVVTHKIADEEDGGESERRYSINANIESEIDNALNNKFYRNHIKLTENTPDILLSQKGVRDLPLYMKPSHVRENIFSEQEALSKGYKIGDGINYHGLGKTKFIEVISDFDNITEAYRGTKNAKNPQRREKYFLLISKIKDVDGNTINVPIYINEYAEYHSVVVETNKVATVFGKEGLNAYLQKEIQKGNLVRIKKKSLQVGDGTAPIAAAFGLKASDTSISNPSEKVNHSDEKNAKKSSEISSERDSLPDEDVESPTLSNVNKERERYKASPKDKVFTWADNAYISAVDEAFGIHKYIVKCGGVPKAKSSSLIQRVRAARAKAETMISDFQYDVITGKELGKGLRKIYADLKDEGYKGKFEDYLLHLLNIDRMTLNERTLAELEKMKAEQDELAKKIKETEKQVDFFKGHNLKEKAKAEKKKLEELKAKNKELKAKIKNHKVLENKPVFGENEERTAAITAEESRKIVEAYEKKHPAFIKIRDELYTFLNNLQDMRVKAGLISAETKNRLAELYPHYVPSMRDTSYGTGSATFSGKNNISVSSTIKKAKGGGQDILSIEESISAQVFEAVEGIEINRLARAIYDAAVKSGDKTYVIVDEKAENTDKIKKANKI